MVKAKDLKIMRKKLTKANRIAEDPIQAIQTMVSSCSSVLQDFAIESAAAAQDSSSSNRDLQQQQQQQLRLSYRTGPELTVDQREEMLQLFETNMGDLYRHSSWGLDLTEKMQEFTNDKARHFLVANERENSKIVAFLHFRLCYDDDEEPERVVLYVYELQVDTSMQRQGLGKRLMTLVEALVVAVGLDTILLTVFKKNVSAMQFYRKTLGYEIDCSSPSQFGEVEDYEILCKQVRGDDLI